LFGWSDHRKRGSVPVNFFGIISRINGKENFEHTPACIPLLHIPLLFWLFLFSGLQYGCATNSCSLITPVGLMP
jgi:hypothetical protein